MADKQTKQNNQQKILLDFCENIVPLHTPKQQSYFVYTEDGNITQVKVYGKQSNIKAGHLCHIEGSFSAQTLQDLITSLPSCIFFVVTNVCWNGQIHSIKTASTQKHLIIISNSLPTDLINLADNQINTLLTEKNITLIINEDGRLMSSQYNHQKCVLIASNDDVVVGDNANNFIPQHRLIRATAQEALSKQPSNNANTNQTPDEILLLKKSHLPLNIPTKYVAMTANNVAKTKNIGIFKSHNTILVPNYGISPLAIKILNYYFNLHVIPLTYDINKYLSANISYKLPFNGIVLPTSYHSSSIDTDMKNKISAIIATKKPVLTFGYGSNIIADIMNIAIITETNIAKVDDYQIYDNYNNIYTMSMLEYSYFKNIPYGFYPQFYDQCNHNIVGIENENIFAYTFDCLNNTTYTARILDKFDRKMNEANKH